MLRGPAVRLAMLPFVLVLVLAACNSMHSPVSPSPDTLRLEGIVTSASALAVQGVIRNGPALSPSGGPAITVSGNQTVLNGGTMVATISAASSFNTIYVRVGAKTLGLTVEAPGGIEGYYEIHLPTLETSAPVLLTFSIGEFRQLLAGFRDVRIVPERFPVKSRLHAGWKGVVYNGLFVGTFNALPRALVRRFGWHLLAFCRK